MDFLYKPMDILDKPMKTSFVHFITKVEWKFQIGKWAMSEWTRFINHSFISHPTTLHFSILGESFIILLRISRPPCIHDVNWKKSHFTREVDKRQMNLHLTFIYTFPRLPKIIDWIDLSYKAIKTKKCKIQPILIIKVLLYSAHVLNHGYKVELMIFNQLSKMQKEALLQGNGIVCVWNGCNVES